MEKIMFSYLILTCLFMSIAKKKNHVYIFIYFFSIFSLVSILAIGESREIGLMTYLASQIGLVAALSLKNKIKNKKEIDQL